MIHMCLLKRLPEKGLILAYKLKDLERNARGKINRPKGCVLEADTQLCVAMLNVKPTQKPARVIKSKDIFSSSYSVQGLFI